MVEQRFKFSRSSVFLFRWILVCISAITLTTIFYTGNQTETWILISLGIAIAIWIQVGIHFLIRKLRDDYV